MHPDTLLNKILVSYDTGELELWNIRSKSLIHSFTTTKWYPETVSLLSTQVEHKQSPSKITCIVQSPAVNIIAIGFTSGLIVLLDISKDKVLFKFHVQGASVTSLSFRSDEVAYLASGDSLGRISVWDLNKKKLHSMIQTAHEASVISVLFLPGQPILVSSGGDNSIKQWIFDETDGSGRLLKSRGGHTQPPTKAKFYEEGNTVLSAGGDGALRYFSVIRDQHSGELSQGSLQSQANKKKKKITDLRLPPVLDFESSPAKEQRWSNIVTCHDNDAAAYAWSFSRKALDRRRLLKNDKNNLSACTCVSLSACGNFVVLGFADGSIEKFNMQSSFFRGAFPAPSSKRKATGGGAGIQSTSSSSSSKKPKHEFNFLNHENSSNNNNNKSKKNKKKSSAGSESGFDPKESGSAGKAHEGAVVGVAVDGMNRVLVSVGADAKVHFWHFSSHQLLSTIELDSPVYRLTFHKGSDLLAVVTEDLRIRVIDLHTSRVVRKFGNVPAGVTDLLFSPDGKWLVVSAMDATVRVFDLASGLLLDWFRFSSPATSLSFSPKSEFLLSTHSGHLGLFIWVNRSYFSSVYSSGPPSNPGALALPVAGSTDLLQQNQQQQLSLQTQALDSKQQQDEEDSSASDSDRTDSENSEDSDDSDSSDSNDATDPFGLVGFSSDSLNDSTKSNLISLSGLPKSRWVNLTQLEQIKQRNKPIEAPKKPDNAPFFLASVSGLQPALAPVEVKEESAADQAKSLSQILNLGADGIRMKSRLIELLEDMRVKLTSQAEGENEEESKTRAEADVTAYLSELPPSQLDAEIRGLGLDMTYEEEEVGLMLDYFLAAVKSRQTFELVQALMNLFLKVHSETICKSNALAEQAGELATLHRKVWSELHDLFQHNLCIVSFLAKTL